MHEVFNYQKGVPVSLHPKFIKGRYFTRLNLYHILRMGEGVLISYGGGPAIKEGVLIVMPFFCFNIFVFGNYYELQLQMTFCEINTGFDMLIF